LAVYAINPIGCFEQDCRSPSIIDLLIWISLMKMRSLLCWLPLFLSAAVFAEPAEEEVQIRQLLSQRVPGLEIQSVEPSVINGVYEVRSNHQETLFVSADGQYFVVGELYQVKPEGLVNLSEVNKQKERAQVLASLKESDMVVFKPKQTKATITVFTDVDCGYCRKLHQEVPRLNELGIQVNYMAYPRAGVGSPTYRQMVGVWCADDQKQAMTRAKNGQAVPNKECKNPVADQFKLGSSLGVTGTPSIFLEDGRVIPGYVPADKLAEGLGLVK